MFFHSVPSASVVGRRYSGFLNVRSATSPAPAASGNERRRSQRRLGRTESVAMGEGESLPWIGFSGAALAGSAGNGAVGRPAREGNGARERRGALRGRSEMGAAHPVQMGAARPVGDG